MRKIPTADRLDLLASRWAEHIEDASLIRRGAKELREIHEGFNAMVKLAADRKIHLEALSERQDTLRDLIAVLRLEAADGHTTLDTEALIRDFTNVLAGEDLEHLEAVTVH